MRRCFLLIIVFVPITIVLDDFRYEHYDAEATPGRSTKRKKSDDPFSDKYFEIMDRVQELHLVSKSFFFSQICFH